MDSLLPIINNVTSVVLAVACWWLAHTYSAARYPHGQAIAAVFGLIGMVTLTITFARHMGVDPTWLHVIFKLLLLAVCLLLARRVQINRRRIESLTA